MCSRSLLHVFSPRFSYKIHGASAFVPNICVVLTPPFLTTYTLLHIILVFLSFSRFTIMPHGSYMKESDRSVTGTARTDPQTSISNGG